MTLESGHGSDGSDREQNKSSDSAGAPTKGDKPTRKISKTIMEGTTPQVPEDAAKGKLAKTKLEMVRPIPGDDESHEGQSGAPGVEPSAKLARTMPEMLRPDLIEAASASDAEHPSASGAEHSPASDPEHQEQSSDAVPEPRRVAKTVLELALPADFSAVKQGKKVRKTLLDTDKVSAPEPRSERYAAKTMLDYQVLSSALEKSAEKKKVRADELALERANEPVKEFHQVDSKKLAMPCSFTWSENNGNERVRACSQCRTQLYDFTGMELADAEALIFKQESVKKATLFKRADGKFMTKDCPLQVRRRKRFLLLGAFAALVILSVMALLIMMPPPPTPPEPAVVKSSTSPRNSKSVENTPLQGNGTFHYRAGEPEDVQPDSNSSAVSGIPLPASGGTSATTSSTATPTRTSTTTSATTTTTTPDTELEWDTSGAN
ncbi:MAG TPA: hypothetical protein V6C89_10840 [Drouetiella sp.]|jgi:hypothetical protein